MINRSNMYYAGTAGSYIPASPMSAMMPEQGYYPSMHSEMPMSPSPMAYGGGYGGGYGGYGGGYGAPGYGGYGASYGAGYYGHGGYATYPTTYQPTVILSSSGRRRRRRHRHHHHHGGFLGYL